MTFQELATRVSHRNTGRVCNDPIADRMLQRIAADENLHMIFYRNMCSAALDLAPDQTLNALANVLENFRMPGQGMPNFRRNGVLMAKNGIYDLRQHLEEVVMPNLRKWRIFERTDFTAKGEQRREQLMRFSRNSRSRRPVSRSSATECSLERPQNGNAPRRKGDVVASERFR